MDLIEVLWKQDVDLGFSLDVANGKGDKPEADLQNDSPSSSISMENDDVEKLKTLKAINEDSIKEEPENELTDPWAGFNYTIDTETGEYVVKAEELTESLNGADCGPSCDLPLGDLSLPLPEFLLDEALRLVELDDTPQEAINVKELENLAEESSDTEPSTSTSKSSETPSSSKDSDDDLSILTDMIQTSQFHHPHHRAFQVLSF
jgi:hypothetical protein